MGLRNILECDVCKDVAAADADLSTWRRVSTEPWLPAMPSGMGQFEPVVPIVPAALCPKPECLRAWTEIQLTPPPPPPPPPEPEPVVASTDG